ncbi:MAG: hypothetical protein ACRYFX_11830 [Janthinobacterium lividum]
MQTNQLLVLLAFGLGGAFSATAQTGRIAALSHGGSPATMAAEEAADNFGLPSMQFEADTIVATSDSTAVIHGREGRFRPLTRTTQTIHYGPRYYQGSSAAGPKSRATAVRLLQQDYPQAKLIDFDTLTKPAAAPAPGAKKQKSKRKQKAVGAFFTLPQHPGVWLAVATMLGLAATGLLLGDKPLKPLKSLT